MVEPVDARQQQALDRDADEADGKRREDEGREIADVKAPQQHPDEESAHHVEGALRDVGDAEQAKDDREAEAHHRVKGAVDQPDQQLTEEDLGAHLISPAPT